MVGPPTVSVVPAVRSRLRLGHLHRGLQVVQRRSGVAVGRPQKFSDRTFFQRHADDRPRPRSLSASARSINVTNCSSLNACRRNITRSRQERRVHGEIRILRGRPDEHHGAVLHRRQQAHLAAPC